MIADLVAILSFHTNPAKAIQMAAYMKNNFLFLGIQKPQLTLLQKQWISKITDDIEMNKVNTKLIYDLWELPEREYQYVAISLLNDSWKKDRRKEDIMLCHYLITNKSWWDSIDSISTNILSDLVKLYPDVVEEYILPWSIQKENMWLRRASILCQLKFKSSTNTKLLEQIILSNCDTNEFFLNKAIGWALREYSKTNKEWVKVFLKNHRLNALTFREASKYL